MSAARKPCVRDALVELREHLREVGHARHADGRPDACAAYLDAMDRVEAVRTHAHCACAECGSCGACTDGRFDDPVHGGVLCEECADLRGIEVKVLNAEWRARLARECV